MPPNTVFVWESSKCQTVSVKFELSDIYELKTYNTRKKTYNTRMKFEKNVAELESLHFFSISIHLSIKPTGKLTKHGKQKR